MEPEWKFDCKAIMPGQVVTQWVSEKERALLLVALLTIEVEAKETFKFKVDELMNIPESKVSENELNEFG